MSILNPNVKTTQLPEGITWASLKAVTRDLKYDFLVNPEEVTWNHQAVYKDLPVLYTGQPLVSYQNSQSGLSMPKVYLWTPGNSGSLKASIDILKAMTKPTLGEDTPPVLSLSWGDLKEPRVYLKSFNLREQQWRQGTVTQATAALEFILAPTPPAVQKTEVALKLSSREQQDYVKKILDTLKKDKNRAKSLGIDPKKALKIGSDGTVFYEDKPIGRLKDKFSDLMLAKHKTL